MKTTCSNESYKENIEECPHRKKCGNECSFNCKWLNLEREKDETLVQFKGAKKIYMEEYFIPGEMLKQFWCGIVWDGTTPKGPKWNISDYEKEILIKKILKTFVSDNHLNGTRRIYSKEEVMYRTTNDDDCYVGHFEGIRIVYETILED